MIFNFCICVGLHASEAAAQHISPAASARQKRKLDFINLVLLPLGGNPDQQAGVQTGAATSLEQLSGSKDDAIPRTQQTNDATKEVQ